MQQAAVPVHSLFWSCRQSHLKCVHWVHQPAGQHGQPLLFGSKIGIADHTLMAVITFSYPVLLPLLMAVMFETGTQLDS